MDTGHDTAYSIKNSLLDFGRRNGRWLYPVIAIVIAFGVSYAVFGSHMFDASVPVQGDVRAHIFKIEIFHQHISELSWPGWVPYWYEGIPINQYYPPGYYIIGALLTFVTGQAVVAYKVLAFLAMAACGLSAYFFMRHFLRTTPVLALLALLAYEISVPLLLNFTMGEGPNLLGWSLSLVFLAVYLRNASGGDFHGLSRKLLPGILLGLTILVHPFPAVFATLAIAVYHVARVIHSRRVPYRTGAQFGYLALTAAIGLVIGAYYWLPLLLTLDFASPIYGFTELQWYGGIKFLLAISITALVMGLIARRKADADGKMRLDFLIGSLLLANALGAGLARIFPLGLGSFLQDFRFDTIIAPFFGIILIAHSLDYYLSYRIRTRSLLLAVTGGLALSIVFLLVEAVRKDGLEANLIGALTSENMALFVLLIFPVASLLLLLAFQARTGTKRRLHPVPAVSAGICILLLVTVLPYFQTSGNLGLWRLFQYTDNYLTEDYDALMDAVEDSRLVVPMRNGFLVEGDNPVTFGWRWGVETVNGPYNQGDPKFFRHTVHLEWEERWLRYEHVRRNLLQEAGAGYVFTRSYLELPGDQQGMHLAVSNDYGKIYALDEEVSRAVQVTPILLDVENPRAVTEFFNILLPGGYRFVFVQADEADAAVADSFQYVMVDRGLKVGNYPGKTVFLLENSPDGAIESKRDYINVRVPYLRMSNRYFYHGDEANVYMWLGTDAFAGARLSDDDQERLKSLGAAFEGTLARLDYAPAGYRYDEGRTTLETRPGFTLVKDSYFPYWQTENGTIMTTSQGFMLVHSGSGKVRLDYRTPLSVKGAAGITLLGLAGAGGLGLLLGARSFRRMSRRAHWSSPV